MDSAVSVSLGGEEVLGPSISSNLDLARATREGLPTRAAIELANEILEEEAQPDLPRSVAMLSAVREMRKLTGSINPQDARFAASMIESYVADISGGMVGWSRPLDLFGAAMGPLGAVICSLIGTLLVQEASEQLRARLTSAESDVVVRTATALARATEVLGNNKKAVHWLNSPNKALGGEVPMSLLDTSTGEHEVQSLLDRIEYGVYS